METGQNAAQILQGRISLELLPQNILLLRLGEEENSLVFFDQQTLALLTAALEKVREMRPRGLILSGSDGEVFSLGLDPEMLAGLSDSSAALALAAAGQAALSLLEGFSFPTVCAISGPCLGAGFELALACRRRIISSQKSSVIGFPGLKAGILPAFGGTGRLLKLAGLPITARILLEEEVLRPAQALRCGLVDEVASVSEIIEKSVRMVVFDTARYRNRMGLSDRFFTGLKLGRRLARRQIEARLAEQRRNHYPAAQIALESIFAELEIGGTVGLERQAGAFAGSVCSAECHSALRIGFLAEQAASLGRQAEHRVRHMRVVVVGADQRGAEMAACFARQNCAVLLKDSDESRLQAARSHVRAHLLNLGDLSDQEKSFLFNRLEISSGVPGSEGNAGFAIEALPDEIDSKKACLEQLSSLLPQDALIATGGVAFSIAELAAGLPSPDRFLGMRFSRPVEHSKLVEIARGRQTSDRSLVLAAAFAVRLGKTPVVVRDSPGFISDRLFLVYASEAVSALEYCGVEEIDRALTSFGLRQGPFEALDEYGLDEALFLQQRLKSSFAARVDGLETLESMLKAGKKGKRAGAGFYNYQAGRRVASEDYREVLGCQGVQSGKSGVQTVLERILMRVVNEAVFCLDEGVAGRPGKEAAGQIDLISVLGLGFPVFRSGVLFFAENLGIGEVLTRLTAFKDQFGERFLAAPGLRLRAERRKSFYSG